MRRALGEISQEIGRTATEAALYSAFTRAGLDPPSFFLSASSGRPHVSPPSDGAVQASRGGAQAGRDGVRSTLTGDVDDIESLMSACRGGVTFEDLCDRLDLPPGKLRGLISRAQESGRTVDVAGGVVRWRDPEPNKCPEDIAAPVGSAGMVAAISDTHFGSAYHMSGALKHFIDHAYNLGVRVVFHAGDVLDGCYEHSRFHMSHHGIDAQTAAAINALPNKPGLNYYFISGNHDETFTQRSGAETGLLIEDRFRREGRDDIHYLGCRGGRANLGGVTFELWHPRSGRAYARSYHVQKHIAAYGPGEKPDILLIGHYHQDMAWEERGVHAYGLPCFKSSLTPFEKSLGLGGSMGGIVLTWRRTEQGTLRHVTHERLSYWERESVRKIAMPPGIPVSEVQLD